jgi:hypothetical protein
MLKKLALKAAATFRSPSYETLALQGTRGPTVAFANPRRSSFSSFSSVQDEPATEALATEVFGARHHGCSTREEMRIFPSVATRSDVDMAESEERPDWHQSL